MRNQRYTITNYNTGINYNIDMKILLYYIIFKTKISLEFFHLFKLMFTINVKKCNKIDIALS